MIKKKPFVKYDPDAKPSNTVVIWLNDEEREWIDAMKKRLRQPKDSTTLKQLAKIGTKTINSDLIGDILDIVFKNKAKNRKSGNEFF